MTHKVSPFAHRLGVTTPWRSRWFMRNIPQYLKEDYYIREFLTRRLDRTSTEVVEIERTQSQTNILIRTSRPGLLIGRQGGGIEKIRQDLLRFLAKRFRGKVFSRNVKLTVEEIKYPETQAKLVAENLAQDLEKRLPFRRVMKQALERVAANKSVEGVKIAISGRLGGADMSRAEWLKRGRIPLQTFRANIDYGFATAYTVQGTIGVKVWIYKGDVFDDKAKIKGQKLK